MELGAVHCILDGDPEKSPTCYHIPHDTEADQEEARIMGSSYTWDAGGGDSAQLRAISHHLPHRGYQ